MNPETDDGWSPLRLAPLFRLLKERGLRAPIVGGQAVNLWAQQAESLYPKEAETAELREHLPWTSRDLDCHGGLEEGADLIEWLRPVTSKLNREMVPTPSAAVLQILLDGKPLLIDVVTHCTGLDGSEITRSAILLRNNEVGEVIVMHPLHCLVGKAASLQTLDQSHRQDAKHLAMSIRLLHLHLRLGLLGEPLETRPLLNLVERVHAIAAGESGLHAWRNGFLIEEAVPTRHLAASEDPKIRAFLEVRLPQLTQQLAIKRERRKRLLEGKSHKES